MLKIKLFIIAILLWQFSFSQSSKSISFNVEASNIIGKLEPFWASQIVHPTEFLPTEWGRNLIQLFHETGAAQQYIRIYNQPERAFWLNTDGKIFYDWSHFDEMADVILSTGNKLKVMFYGMPFELAVYPEHLRRRPYGGVVCSSPPKDYKLWEELCIDFINHVISRYSLEEVKKWHFRCWNEPDGSSFWYEGDLNEYMRLYDHFAKAIKSVSKDIKVGGPGFTHGSNLYKPENLKLFFDHVTSGINHATGEVGSPIDFISIHTYGGNAGGGPPGKKFPELDYVIKQQLRVANLRNEYPQLRKIPIHVDEWGASSGGRVNMDKNPMAVIRNSQYAAAFLIALVERHVNLRGKNDLNISNLTFCASGYEVIPERDFMGYRTLDTKNGFHKPILNAYKILFRLAPNLVTVKANQSNDHISAFATRDDKRITIMVVNYQNDRIYNDGQSYPVSLNIESNWKLKSNVTLKHWRIDEHHSNAYTIFKETGSPDLPNPLEIDKIKKRMDIELLEQSENKQLMEFNKIEFELPCNAVSLIEIIKN